MADDHSRPIDAPRNPTERANESLGLVLGPKIRQAEPFGFAEHFFREHAAVATRRRDRTDEMETARLRIVREVERVARSEYIGAHQIGVRGVQVVQRAQMKEM